MKFNVTWIQEKTMEIDVADLAAAEAYGVALIGRLGGFPIAKLLSIHEIKPAQRKDDKPPTPFDRPPEGTPGAGQMRIDEQFVELVGKRLVSAEEFQPCAA